VAQELTPGEVDLSDDHREPHIVEGGLHVDARGKVTFVNDFDFNGVERFYTIRAHRSHEPRGWRGHRIEHKWFTVVQGTILLSVVKPDDWTLPASNLPVERFVMSDAKPAILSVSPGHATASMALSDGAILIVFSSGRIQEAKKDDYLFPLDTWQIQQA